VTWLRAGPSRVKIPEGARNFSLLQDVGSTQPPVPWVPGALCPQQKRLRREADYSPPSNVVVRNERVYTSIPQSDVTTCTRTVYRYVVIIYCQINFEWPTDCHFATCVVCMQYFGSNPKTGSYIPWEWLTTVCWAEFYISEASTPCYISGRQ
jgi:hypothetical protein